MPHGQVYSANRPVETELATCPLNIPLTLMTVESTQTEGPRYPASLGYLGHWYFADNAMTSMLSSRLVM